MKYIHLRWHFHESKTPQNETGTSNIGGVTAAYDYNPTNGVFKYALSFCKLKGFKKNHKGDTAPIGDNFARKFARDACETMFKAGDYYETVLDCQTPLHDLIQTFLIPRMMEKYQSKLQLNDIQIDNLSQYLW